MRCILLAALVGLCACEGPGDRAAPTGDLERAIFFQERDERGGTFPISARSADGAEVERVADGATIDVNSKLLVRPDTSSLGDALDEQRVHALVGRAEELASLLEGIDAYVQVQVEALEGWNALQALDPARRAGSRALAHFTQLRQTAGNAELQLLEPVRELWPRTSPDREQVEELVGQLASDPPAAALGLGALVQQRIDDLGEELRALEDEADRMARRRRLRIEAFASSVEAEQSEQVHVEGYDDLDAGRVQRIDRFGLTLTAAERERLEALAAESRQIANLLEKIRAGETDWRTAFRGSSSRLVQELDGLAVLAAGLEPANLRRRVEATREAQQALLQGVRTAFGEAEAVPAVLLEVEGVEDLVQELERVREAIAGLQSLKGRWSALEPADVPDLLVESAQVGRQLEALLRELDLERSITAALQGLRASLAEGPLADLWVGSDLQRQLVSWRELGASARGGLELVQALLGMESAPAATFDLESSASFSVPLETAGDGWIDLQTTKVVPGDRLHVRVRLVEEPLAGEEKDVVPPLRASLSLEKLGWHADLEPSVVFATADQNQGADDDAGFSAALAWMWSYGTRDDEDDPWLSRALGWGAGLHAVLLSFPPDNDAEVGLGVTLGLWDSRLLVGAGLNPFADESEDAEVYYFVGSSLIPLLQALDRDE